MARIKIEDLADGFELKQEEMADFRGGSAPKQTVTGIKGITSGAPDFSATMTGAKPGEVRGFLDPDENTSYDLKGTSDSNITSISVPKKTTD